MWQTGRRAQLFGVGPRVAELGGIRVGQAIGQVGLEAVGELVDLVGSQVGQRDPDSRGEVGDGGRGQG